MKAGTGSYLYLCVTMHIFSYIVGAKDKTFNGKTIVCAFGGLIWIKSLVLLLAEHLLGGLRLRWWGPAHILAGLFMRIRWDDTRESVLKFKGIFENFFLVVEVDNRLAQSVCLFCLYSV